MRIRIKKYLITISLKGIRIQKNPTKKLFEDLKRQSGRYMEEYRKRYGE